MVNWNEWIKRWDKQQERYIPNREQRFELMFDIVESYLGKEFVALDLGCGPGSLSDRLTSRFPSARVYAIDVDPMLLKIAKNSIGNKEGRIQWIEADLRSDIWFDSIDENAVTAVLSSTALHWLPPADLMSLYYKLYKIMNEHGVFINAEGISFSSGYKKFETIIDGVKELRLQRRDEPEGEEWDEFWDNLKNEFIEHDLGKLVNEREERFHWRDHSEHRSPPYEVQRSVLSDAGFSEVGIIWQDLKNRILLAIK